ncbi:hypothetical protein GCM10027169_29650 [Gordonia jinhuaensis]
MVVTAGTVPSSNSDETFSTVLAARLETTPKPPANGNNRPATNTPASTKHTTSPATARAGERPRDFDTPTGYGFGAWGLPPIRRVAAFSDV